MASVIQGAKEEKPQEEKTYVVTDDGVIPEKTSLMSQLKAQEKEKYFLPHVVSHVDSIDYQKVAEMLDGIRGRNIRNRAPV